MMVLVHIYWNRKSGAVIVPTVAKTEAGYWLDVEPVAQASWTDIQSVVSAVREAASRDVMIVPTPSRQSFPKHVVLEYAKAKSTNEFEKKFDMASIQNSAQGSYSINRYKNSPTGSGRVVDPTTSMTFAPGISLETVLEDLSRNI